MPTLIFSRVGACPPCSPRAGAHELNNLPYAQFSRPLGKTQSTNVQAEIGLHSYTVGNKLLANVIELQTFRRAKQNVPQDYKIHTPKRNQNATHASTQQQSEPWNAGDNVVRTNFGVVVEEASGEPRTAESRGWGSWEGDSQPLPTN